MFSTILAAVDGSEHAGRALAAAVELARVHDAKLHLVHVPELELVAMAVGVAPVALPHTAEDVALAGRKVMDAAVAEARRRGVGPVSAHIAEGDPAHVIHDRATEIGADLIVSGRRGMGRLGGLLLGSVSQKIGQIAPCAYLTVK